MEGEIVSEKEKKFSKETRDKCWEKAEYLLGRSPNRWRLDAVGTPVLFDHHGKNGACGFQYDHVVAASNGGSNDLSNCQILQTQLNKRKAAKENVKHSDLVGMSNNIKFNGDQLDLVELGAHGNLLNECDEMICTLASVDQVHGLARRRGETFCELPDPCTVCTKKESPCEAVMNKFYSNMRLNSPTRSPRLKK